MRKSEVVNILLIEKGQFGLKKYLETAGYRVFTAEDSDTAQNLLDSPRDFDLILMDSELETVFFKKGSIGESGNYIEIPVIYIAPCMDGKGSDKTRFTVRYGDSENSTELNILTSFIKSITEQSGPKISINSGFSNQADTYNKEQNLESIEELLIQKDSMLNAIIESSPDVIVFALDKNYKYISFNTNHRKIMKQIWGKEIFIGDCMLDIISVDSDREKARENFDRALSGEYFMLTEEYGDEKLSRLYWSDYYSPLISQDDSIIGLSCFVLNHTRQRQAEEQVKNLLAEKELLLREVHHRIKNNMNVTQSLLRLQADALSNEEAKIVLDNAAVRVQSMMVLYDKLYRSESILSVSLKTYIETLLQEIKSTVNWVDSIALETDITDVTIDTGILSPLGIIMNELMTNSIKHAFKGKEKGTITVTGKIENNLLKISYSDNGSGFKENTDSDEGFGMQLIDILSRQIKATLSINRNNGTRVDLSLPVQEN